LKSIVLIEDDHDIRVSLGEALEGEGYSVHSAANGIEGIALLKRIKPPSLILLDQNMPLMSGEELLKLKAIDQDLAPIPVVVISAVADRTRLLGAVDFLAKPVDLEVLLRTVERYCI
jgi:CheY-like chemotaxis protein